MKIEDRNKAIEYIARKGRFLWATNSGYSLCNHVEAAIARMKKTFSPALRSRTKHNKKAEITSKIAILNTFASIGMPQSYLVT